MRGTAATAVITRSIRVPERVAMVVTGVTEVPRLAVAGAMVVTVLEEEELAVAPARPQAGPEALRVAAVLGFRLALSACQVLQAWPCRGVRARRAR